MMGAMMLDGGLVVLLVLVVLVLGLVALAKHLWKAA